MFKIEEAQVAEISAAQTLAFKAMVAERLRDLFALRFSWVEPVDLDAFVDLGIERATGWKLAERGAVRSYIDHMVIFGAYFDVDPAWNSISSILAEDRFDIARMDALYAAMTPAREKLAGKNGEPSIAAAARLRRMLVDLDDAPPANRIETIGRIFPERAELYGNAQTEQVVEAFADESAERGLDSPTGKFAYAAIAFVAGSRFLDNPSMTPLSVRAAFEDARAKSGTEAEALMRARAIEGLDASLAHIREIAPESSPADV